jgi:DNA-binding SARP family transcriptional activator
VIDFRLLGTLEAVEDGRPLPLGGPQQRAVLATLLLHANELVPAERLIDMVWGGRPPPTAATVVQVYISRLRKLLGRELLVSRAPGYLLRVSPDQIDIGRAERLIAVARETQEPARRSALLRDALALWRGAALADFAYEELGREEAERLEELRLTTLEWTIEAELELGHHAELVAELEALLEEHPVRERLRSQLMLALYRAGRQADALSVYRDGRTKLVQELGLEPGPSLQRLERRILTHDPTLDAAQPPDRAGSREERKSVSALFAEVILFDDEVDAPLDPEEAKRLLEPCFARIGEELERFGGSVETLIGDTVRAVFGAPVAYEDHAERAVRAALAVRDLMAAHGRIGIRVGISTGEALVRTRKSPDEAGVAFGAVFGRADRIRSDAPTNAILVADSTYRATLDTIAYRRHDGGAMWEALRAKTAIRGERPRAGDIALVGRTQELGLLSEKIRSATETRTPELLTIVGAPGIGKTRLLRELAARLRPSRTLWLQGRSIPYGDGVAYWAFAEAVKAYAKILDTDAPAQAARKVRRAVTRAAPDGPKTVENHLRALLGLETDEVATERAAAFSAWRRFLDGIATRHPLVLVLEDMHWADEGLLDFVEHIAASSDGTPAVFLCTARPDLLDRRPFWAAAAPHATTVDLSPLSDEEIRALVGALLEDRSLPTNLAERLVSRVDGNPLFAEEYVRTLVERGVLRRAHSGWQLDADADDQPPESVHDVIAARIDGLPLDAKSLLQDAAVIGKVFWPGSVAAIGGRSRKASEAQLEHLALRGLVRQDERSAVQDEAQYTFKHVLTRDVAYGQIPRVERSAKHRRAAEWIESHARADDVAELLAHHYVNALEFARAHGIEWQDLVERSVEALWRAGERSRQLYANEDAAAYFRQALTILGESPTADPVRSTEPALSLRESLGDILELTGKHRDGEAAFCAALGLTSTDDHLRRSRLFRKQALSRQLQRRVEGAFAALADAENALGDKASGTHWWQERCEVGVQRLEVLYFGGALDAFVEEFERVKSLVLTRGTPAQRSALFTWHSMVLLRRDRFITSDETLSDQRAALAAALESGNTRVIAQKRFTYGFGLLWAGQLDDAETQMQESLAQATRVGDVTTRVRCLNFLGVTARKRGDVESARELGCRTLEVAQGSGKLEYVLQAHATLAWVAWRQGDLDLTEKHAQSALTGWDDVFQMRVFAWMAHWPLLGVALARSDETEAVEHARTILDPTRQPMPAKLESTLAAAVAARDSGDLQAVHRRFDQARELATRDGYL